MVICLSRYRIRKFWFWRPSMSLSTHGLFTFSPLRWTSPTKCRCNWLFPCCCCCERLSCHVIYFFLRVKTQLFSQDCCALPGFPASLYSRISRFLSAVVWQEKSIKIKKPRGYCECFFWGVGGSQNKTERQNTFQESDKTSERRRKKMIPFILSCRKKLRKYTMHVGMAVVKYDLQK